MESNWRFNVWELGFSGSTIRLAARLRGYPFPIWVTLIEPDVNTRWQGFILGFDPTFGWQSVLSNLDPVGPFPFGYDVDPDSPML